MRFTLLFCLAFFAFCDAFASPIFDKIPDEIDPNAKYIFYSHGYIVEGEDPTPVHPGWGMSSPSIEKQIVAPPHMLRN